MKHVQMAEWVNRINENLARLETRLVTELKDDDVDAFLNELQRHYQLIALLKGVKLGKVLLTGFNFNRLKRDGDQQSAAR